MKPVTFALVPALVLCLGLTGCNDNATRSDYPDRSAETRAEADAIRQEGERREALIERDLQQSLTSLAFSEKQQADKAKLERENIELERDRKVQPLEAKKAEIEAKAKRDSAQIDQETEANTATIAGEESAKVKADAASRKAEINRDLTARVAEIEADIREAKQAAQARIVNVNEGEAKELADIATKRAEAQRKAREEKLTVKSETTAKLDRLGKDSAERLEDRRTRDNKVHESDERITAEVRKGIANHGDTARDVTVTTDNGVVVLNGTVKNDTVRQQVANDAQRAAGVVRVDNRIVVR